MIRAGGIRLLGIERASARPGHPPGSAARSGRARGPSASPERQARPLRCPLAWVGTAHTGRAPARRGRRPAATPRPEPAMAARYGRREFLARVHPAAPCSGRRRPRRPSGPPYPGRRPNRRSSRLARLGRQPGTGPASGAPAGSESFRPSESARACHRSQAVPGAPGRARESLPKGRIGSHVGSAEDAGWPRTCRLGRRFVQLIARCLHRGACRALPRSVRAQCRSPW